MTGRLLQLAAAPVGCWRWTCPHYLRADAVVAVHVGGAGAHRTIPGGAAPTGTWLLRMEKSAHREGVSFVDRSPAVETGVWGAGAGP